MYGVGFTRAASLRMMSTHRFTPMAQHFYKPPSYIRTPVVSLTSLAASRIANLAFSFDHFLVQENGGDLESSYEEIMQALMNTESITMQSIK